MRAILVVAAIISMAAARPLAADDRRDFNILLFSSFESGSIRITETVDGLMAALDEAGHGASIYLIALDEIRFPSDEESNELAFRFAERRFSSIKFDVILAQGTAAYDMAVTYRKSHGLELPIVVFHALSSGVDRRHADEKDIFGRILTTPIEPTLEIMKKLFPKARSLVAVGSRGGIGMESLFALLDEEGRKDRRFRVEIAADEGIETIEGRLAAADAPVCLVYSIAWITHDGLTVSGKSLVSRISEDFDVPTFSILGDLFGSGLVGGYFFDDESVGRETAGIVLDILLGRAEPLHWAVSSAMLPTFDHRALRRFSIPLSALPEGARVDFSPPPFWIRYQYYLEALGVLLVVSTVLLSMRLILKRRDRMTLERANAELETKVESRTEELKAANAELERANANLVESLRRIEAMQDRMVSDARESVLGRLALGLAHEVNNPLGAIKASNDTMLELISNGRSGIAPRMLAMEREKLKFFVSLAAEKSDGVIRTSPLSREQRDGLIERLRRFGVDDPTTTADLVSDAGADGLDDDRLARLCDPANRDVLEALFLIAALARSVAVSGVAARKMADTIETIRSYAREYASSAPRSAVDLAASIEDGVRLLADAADRGPTMRRDLRLPLGAVAADRAALARLWANLLQNAIEAAGDEGDILVRAYAEGGLAVVEVWDSGPGVPEDIRARLFEPLAADLGEGFRGLGLGLSICKRIAEGAGGSIEHGESEGRTVFRVRLPLALPAA